MLTQEELMGALKSLATDEQDDRVSTIADLSTKVVELYEETESLMTKLQESEGKTEQLRQQNLDLLLGGTHSTGESIVEGDSDSFDLEEFLGGEVNGY